MNIKRILAVAALASMSLLAFAQEAEKPIRLGFAVSAGANNYVNISALPGTLASYEMQALSANWTDKGTAFGFEGSMVIKNAWKLDLGGTFGFGFNPGRSAVIGTVTPGEVLTPGDIPTYKSVATQQNMNYLVYFAASRYINVPAVPALKPYAGLKAGASYAQSQMHEDSVLAMGISAAETLGAFGSVVVGADYYVTPNLFLGISLDAVKYTYGYTAFRPQEGLANMVADTHFISALASPMFKVGVLF